MKLKDGFITSQSDGEQIMVATGENAFAGLVRSNQTAGFIVDCLKKETSIEQIVDRILEEYDADRGQVEKDVLGIVDKLRGIGAIDE